MANPEHVEVVKNGVEAIAEWIERMMSMEIENDPRRKGQLAARKQLFGPHHRYAVAPVHTRFDTLVWMVWDAEEIDRETGLIAIIRQEPTREAAVAGLTVDGDFSSAAQA